MCSSCKCPNCDTALTVVLVLHPIVLPPCKWQVDMPILNHWCRECGYRRNSPHDFSLLPGYRLSDVMIR